MTELRPRSELPEDPAYWDRLARRIAADAAAPLAGYGAAEATWYDLLARRASWLVAASVATMLVLWLALPEPGPSPAFRWMEQEVAPSEVADTLGGPTPPSVNVVLAQFPPPASEEPR